MNIRRKFGEIRKNISLVDRCLLIIMMILMLQTTYTLFVNETVSQEANTIDVIVRTSAAAIFGYFLSGNFMKKNNSVSQTNTQTMILTKDSNDALKNQIGFSATAESAPMQLGTAGLNDPPPKLSNHNKMQIIMISSIGIFALCMLLILRNFASITPDSAATVSQLRDFVSACVGFLVSYGKNISETVS